MKYFRHIFLVLACILLLTGCDVGKKNLSVSPYILTKVTGLSGRADAKVYLDTEGMYIALAGIDATAEQRAVYDDFIKSFGVTTDRLEGLANGDRIVVTVTYSQELADALKVNVNDFIKSVEVSGLTVGEEVDLFKDLEVSVSGIIPYAKLTVTNKSTHPYISQLTYQVNGDTTRLKNGDVINISTDYDAKTAEGYSIYTDVYEMDYTIVGLDQYIYDKSLLDTFALSEIASECADTIVSETEDTTTRMLYKLTKVTDYLYQDNHERVDSINLNQVIFLSRDVEGTTEYENVIYFVFEAKIANTNYSSTGYYIFKYTNGIYGGDGKFYIGTNNPELRYVCGTNFDELYNELVGDSLVLYNSDIVEGVEVWD